MRTRDLHIILKRSTGANPARNARPPPEDTACDYIGGFLAASQLRWRGAEAHSYDYYYYYYYNNYYYDYDYDYD